MRKKVMKIGGIVLFLIGCVFILNSFSGITGFVVAESIGKSVSSIIGLVFVLVGVLVFMASWKKNLDEILKSSVKTDHGTLRMKDTRDSLIYTDLKAKEKPQKLPKYELFLKKRKYLDNIASKRLFDNNIPESSRESVSDAKECGYDIFPDEGDGNRVKDKDGNIITELGGHPKNNLNTQRGRYKEMAKGESSWRK